MTHFVNYQFSVAMQKERLPKEQLRFMRVHRQKFARRLCLRLGNWLNSVGDWLVHQGQYHNESLKDLELA